MCGDRWRARGTFREFIVRRPEMVYPEWIVYYKRHVDEESLKKMQQSRAEAAELRKAVDARFPTYLPSLGITVSCIRRQMNIELNFPLNFEGLVLGCIDADFCK